MTDRMKYTFIGDAHGYFSRYEKIISDCKNSVQVGDMGVGFLVETPDGPRMSANPPHAKMLKGNHRFIRGNHDNPGVCRNHSQWIKDGTVEVTPAGTKIMYVGGAWSIDWEWRKPNMSWWMDEECSMEQFNTFLDIYSEFKPDVMVTHDAPQEAIKELFINGTHKPLYKSRTGQGLQAMFEGYKPSMWIFGHWHMNKNQIVNGTQFICLDELNTLTIDL